MPTSPSTETLWTCAQSGRFELDVTPGVHEVRISARGYMTQVRRVRVEENGVTVLNIDLRKAP